jgi:hypothetical protein
LVQQKKVLLSDPEPLRRNVRRWLADPSNSWPPGFPPLPVPEETFWGQLAELVESYGHAIPADRLLPENLEGVPPDRGARPRWVRAKWFIQGQLAKDPEAANLGPRERALREKLWAAKRDGYVKLPPSAEDRRRFLRRTAMENLERHLCEQVMHFDFIPLLESIFDEFGKCRDRLERLLKVIARDPAWDDQREAWALEVLEKQRAPVDGFVPDYTPSTPSFVPSPTGTKLTRWVSPLPTQRGVSPAKELRTEIVRPEIHDEVALRDLARRLHKQLAESEARTRWPWGLAGRQREGAPPESWKNIVIRYLATRTTEAGRGRRRLFDDADIAEVVNGSKRSAEAIRKQVTRLLKDPPRRPSNG